MVHRNQPYISHRYWDITFHLLDKHIPVVNALDSYFGDFGEHRGYAIFRNAPMRRIRC